MNRTEELRTGVGHKTTQVLWGHSFVHLEMDVAASDRRPEYDRLSKSRFNFLLQRKAPGWSGYCSYQQLNQVKADSRRICSVLCYVCRADAATADPLSPSQMKGKGTGTPTLSLSLPVWKNWLHGHFSLKGGWGNAFRLLLLIVLYFFLVSLVCGERMNRFGDDFLFFSVKHSLLSSSHLFCF